MKLFLLSLISLSVVVNAGTVCTTISDERSCGATQVCHWNDVTNCTNLPCANITLDSCQLTDRCTVGVSKTCADKNCSEMISEEDCASNELGCVYNSTTSPSCVLVAATTLAPIPDDKKNVTSGPDAPPDSTSSIDQTDTTAATTDVPPTTTTNAAVETTSTDQNVSSAPQETNVPTSTAVEPAPTTISETTESPPPPASSQPHTGDPNTTATPTGTVAPPSQTGDPTTETQPPVATRPPQLSCAEAYEQTQKCPPIRCKLIGGFAGETCAPDPNYVDCRVEYNQTGECPAPSCVLRKGGTECVMNITKPDAGSNETMPPTLDCGETYKEKQVCPEETCELISGISGMVCIAKPLSCRESYETSSKCPSPRCELRKSLDGSSMRCVPATTTPEPTTNTPAPSSAWSGERCKEVYKEFQICPKETCLLEGDQCVFKPQFTLPPTDPVTQAPSLEKYCAQQQRRCPAPICARAMNGNCIPAPKTEPPVTQPPVLPTSCLGAETREVCRQVKGCAWMVSFCMDTSCAALTDQVACKTNGCRWSVNACFDRNAFFKLGCNHFNKDQCAALDRCGWSVADDECINTVPSAPPTAPTSCQKHTSSDSCPLGRCSWTGTQCTTKPCEAISAPHHCDEPRCKWDSETKNCTQPVSCPITAPIFCPQTKLCAASKEKCVRCASNQVQCWDSSCVQYFSQCPCPSSAPVKCASNRCALSEAHCGIQCSGEKPFTCWNNKCAASNMECDCPQDRPIKCADTNVCVRNENECVQNKYCPQEKPTKCWDNRCALNQQRCACSPSVPYRCATRKCVETPSQCPCPDGLLKCNVGNSTQRMCAKTQDQCLAVCAPSLKKCEDSTCRRRCPCMKPLEVSLQIQPLDDEYIVSEPLRIHARGVVTDCGRVVSYGKVSWSVLPSKVGLTHVGSTFNIRPNTLIAGNSYTIVASMTINGSETTDTVTLKAIAPVPEVIINGGDKTVNVKDVLHLRTNVIGGSSISGIQPQVEWRCCIPGANFNMATASRTDCESKCPNSEKTNVKAASLKFKPQQLGWTAGSYLFYATYNNVVGYSLVKVVTTPVINVDLLAPKKPHFTTKNLTLYAVVRHGADDVSLSWTINGKTISVAGPFVHLSPLQLHAASLQDPKSSKWYLKATVAVTSSATGATGSAVAVVMLAIPPAGGTCKVEPVKASGNNKIYAADRISISASGYSSSSDLLYRFGIIRNGKLKPLSPSYNEAQSLSTVAPLVREDVTVTFWVQVAMLGVRGVASATCNVEVLKPVGESIDTLVDQEATKLANAANADDTSAVVQSATLIADAMKPPLSGPQMEAPQREKLAKKIVSALKRTVKNGKDMSTTEKGAIVDTLATVTEASEEATDDSTTQADVKSMVEQVLEDDGEENALDTRQHAKQLLEVIEKLKDKKGAAPLVQKLSLKVGEELEVGEENTLETAEVVMRAQKRVAENVAQEPIETPSASMKLPIGFRPANATDETPVSITAIEHVENPMGQSGIRAGNSMAAKVVEFDISRDGTKDNIMNLVDPIEITLNIDPKDAAKTLTCVFWDGEKGAWSTAGVTRGVVTSTDVTCKTTHLSMFTAVSSVQASRNTTTMNAGKDTSDASSLPSGAIVGAVVGGILLVALIAGIIMSRRNQSPSVGGSPTARRHPPPSRLHEQAVPLRNVVDDPYAVNPNTYGNQYTELQVQQPRHVHRPNLHEL